MGSRLATQKRKTSLAQQGFSQIHYINLENSALDYAIIQESAGPTVTILEANVIHDEVPYLIQASEDIALATGDQSFSEILSAHKILILN